MRGKLNLCFDDSFPRTSADVLLDALDRNGVGLTHTRRPAFEYHRRL